MNEVNSTASVAYEAAVMTERERERKEREVPSIKELGETRSGQKSMMGGDWCELPFATSVFPRIGERFRLLLSPELAPPFLSSPLGPLRPPKSLSVMIVCVCVCVYVSFGEPGSCNWLRSGREWQSAQVGVGTVSECG